MKNSKLAAKKQDKMGIKKEENNANSRRLSIAANVRLSKLIVSVFVVLHRSTFCSFWCRTAPVHVNPISGVWSRIQRLRDVSTATIDQLHSSDHRLHNTKYSHESAEKLCCWSRLTALVLKVCESNRLLQYLVTCSNLYNWATATQTAMMYAPIVIT